MTAVTWFRRAPALFIAVAVLALGSFALIVLPSASQAAGSLPCDIFGAAGTPCVGAYSTTRALYAAYRGPLYQVKRVSDGATTNIGLLTAGGYANSLKQDAFCAHTYCYISELYDQSPKGNNLTIEGPGGAGPSFGQDAGANAAALPVVAGGHRVYGVYFPMKTGYRNDSTTGVAVNGQPEGMYMVASGTHVDSGCCYDFGNAEVSLRDTGASHMDSVNVTTYCEFAPCTGSGPWVEDDMENGQYMGGDGSNPNDTTSNSDFVTAIAKNNGQTSFELEGGNSQSGRLAVFWNGALPNGYAPMHQEGAIVLGTGGGGDNNAVGSFFEGVITAGFPSDAADAAVQANIVSVHYSGASGGGSPPAGTITGAGGQCVDVNGGSNTGIDGAVVDTHTCQPGELGQYWTHNSDDSLTGLGRCLDITGGGTAAGTAVQLWDCNGGANQKWVQQANGALLNPASKLCLRSPGGSSQLELGACSGSAKQGYSINGGSMIDGPGGRCVNVTGAKGTIVDLYTCQSYSNGQHWHHTAGGLLGTLGRCLDTAGGKTAAGTQVGLGNCAGPGNRKWVQQANGALLNPPSRLCLDFPGGRTAKYAPLKIKACNGTSAQKFALS